MTKDYGEGKNFFDCTDEQQWNRLERYKKNRDRMPFFMFIVVIISLAVTILIAGSSCTTTSKYKSPCNVPAIGYGSKK